MTSSSTIISLSNRSLLGIGARAQIQSLTENSTEANAISVLFQPCFEQLARTAPWNCLRKQATLSLLAAAQGTPENVDGTTLPLPPTGWLYSYSLPSDCLDVRYLIPSFVQNSSSQTQTTVNNASQPLVSNNGQIDFAVAYDTDANNNPIQVILTNLSQAICVYTVNQPNPVIFDSLLEGAIVASLAAYLVPALSLNMQLMQMQIKVAEMAIAQARVRDGDEGVTCQDHIPDWIQARSSGTFYGSYNTNGNQYQSMLWPGVF